MDCVNCGVDSGVVVFLTAILACSLRTVNSGGYIDSPDVKITYTNEFKFELKDVHFIVVVKGEAADLGFVYKGQIVEEFFLFIRDDVPRFSDDRYDVKKLKDAEERLTKYVVSIEQDYERQWVGQVPNISVPGGNGYSQTLSYDKHFFLADYAGSRSRSNYSGIHCDRKPANVAFIDAGFELDHPNLKDSVDFLLSHSFLGDSNNMLPPLYEEDMKHAFPRNYYEQLSHGTRCMGRVGAKEGGSCDGGVAPNVRLVGLKALYFNNGLSDTREATALSYKHDEIGVFSCSYGIQDNIGFFEPQSATKKALLNGATKAASRGKGHPDIANRVDPDQLPRFKAAFDLNTLFSQDCRGVVYVYPSGNGHHDNCNADGYASSVDTITISNVDRNGQLPENLEICTATIAATAGEGYNTTDLNSLCSDDFSGSSASTAVAAGYAGELRFLRPCLSKRDIEHIMVTTAVQNDHISWRTNGARLKFNDQIGFGQLDLERMKQAAISWNFVPERHTCIIPHEDTANKHIVGTNWILKTTIPSNGCRDSSDHVRYLEHVQVMMSLRCSNISEVGIQLVSPAGTVSNILTHINLTAERVEQHKNLQWTFMSVNFWKELSDGLWIVKVIVDHALTDVECKYNVERLVLYGTKTNPELGGGPLSCEKNIIRVSTRLDPDEAPSYSAPHLDPNCLHRNCQGYK